MTGESKEERDDTGQLVFRKRLGQTWTNPWTGAARPLPKFQEPRLAFCYIYYIHITYLLT